MSHLPDQKIIAEIKEDNDNFLYENQEITIETQDQYTAAGDKIKEVNTRIRKLEEKRKQYTDPLDDLKKQIMSDFKQMTDPLEEFVDMVKSKMLEFYKAEQKRKDEEQKRIEAEALEKAKQEDVSEVIVPVVNHQLKTQRGYKSTITVKKVWKWRVVDETKVPREYLCLDEKKINLAVRNEVRKIDGLEIYQEETAPVIR